MNIRVADGNMRVFESKSILFPGNLSFLLFDSIEKKKEIRVCCYRTPLNIVWMFFLFRFVLGFNVFVGHYILITGLASPNSIRIDIWAPKTLNEPSLKITNELVSNEIIEFSSISYCFSVRSSFIHVTLTFTRFSLFTVHVTNILWNRNYKAMFRLDYCALYSNERPYDKRPNYISAFDEC